MDSRLNHPCIRFFLLLLISGSLSLPASLAQPDSLHFLRFENISKQWDEGIPLGNGLLGALIWLKDNHLRFSLDRADLWDLRPMPRLEQYSYQWAYQQVLRKNIDSLQMVADWPYDHEAAPSKIPGGALEFDIGSLGEISEVWLDIRHAVCHIRWKQGASLMVWIHATDPVGWYQWEGLEHPPLPTIIPPRYHAESDQPSSNAVVDGQDLLRLGYPAGKLLEEKQEVVYDQTGWGGMHYQIATVHQENGHQMTGTWSLSVKYPAKKGEEAIKTARKALKKGWEKSWPEHDAWWTRFWSQSDIHIPDRALEKQWYLEMYKLGAASRAGAPPISLQAVWTADNGNLPPWKGDFHNDLNVQMSYWPAYSSNHLAAEQSLIDWLWNNKPAFQQYARQYFGATGINVPGVCTLTGQPMGGWHQYSFSPTTGCWFAQHFYQHWLYTRDRKFLKDRAYPWLRETAVFLERITIFKKGQRVLPISSSPEIHDNSLEAWYLQNTNYDLALMHFAFEKASELAGELGLAEDAKHWRLLSDQLPSLATGPDKGLLVAPGEALTESHRHFSHMLSIYPLNLVNYDNPDQRDMVTGSMHNIEKLGTANWCGYSFAWMSVFYARMKNANVAYHLLRAFSDCFCSVNSFHLNGDQCGGKYSKFTYRPFTLEGNFAFAAGLQEMLLQSHSGYVEVFPAIPADWNLVSFNNLRAEGAFLISAKREGGNTDEVSIRSEVGGKLRLKLPFRTWFVSASKGAKSTFNDPRFIEIEFEKGGEIVLKNGYE